MKISKIGTGDRQVDLGGPESALLRQVLEGLREAYATAPGELDPMVANLWYGRNGLREAGIRGEEAMQWVEGLHEARVGRQAALERWLRSLPQPGHAGVWKVGADEIETLVASLNDHRLRRAGEFDLGERDLEVKSMEKARGDRRVALVEIHFLAWMIELLLQE